MEFTLSNVSQLQTEKSKNLGMTYTEIQCDDATIQAQFT